ncbi:myotubularin-related [Anaeramoeba flamelloides]|uniref:Myotubularin-related n=1 Tax=Anaeramoeba flamelloides TaxID=1746091 RepID=A0ABQ8YRJ8_9EUKA|nr:myotubularin-related [Anaeramoeba flamelloides]
MSKNPPSNYPKTNLNSKQKNQNKKNKQTSQNKKNNTSLGSFNESDEEFFDAKLEGIEIFKQNSSSPYFSDSDSYSESEESQTNMYNENNLENKLKNKLELLDGETKSRIEENVKFKITPKSKENFSGEFSYGIEIITKEFRDYKFYLSKKDNKRKAMCHQIMKNTFVQIKKCFAILHKKNKKLCIDPGWEIYYPFFEFKRQGLFENAKWTISDANEKWKICPTYPRELPLPSSITLKDIQAISKFRSKGRLPVLSYYYRKNLTTITRSSQPKVGLTRSRCIEDEKLLKEIAATTENDKLSILDCRPKKNALANMGRHGGFEILSNYGNCTLDFLGIENIHAMRDSLSKLKTLVNQSVVEEKKWLSGLEDTMWLFHIQKILEGSIKIVKYITIGAISVLVHCSDGWDRTAQACSLSQLIIDPYFRTVEGFEVLIEKEWLGYGHKFHQRVGHLNKNARDTQRSPVFLQFIDCVYQILRQFPTAFEFNEDFLIFILKHLFSLQFGTFLYNSNRERLENQINIKTFSLWTYINENKKIFLNSNYEKTEEILIPSISIRALVFWENYYLKAFTPFQKNSNKKKIGVSITNFSKDELSDLIEEKNSNKIKLFQQIQELQSQIEQLEKKQKSKEKIQLTKKKQK